jgi:hypothetical protein
VRRVLNPRWYAAARISSMRPLGYEGCESYEMAVGFRPNTHQVLKFGYTYVHYTLGSDPPDHLVTIQFVTSFRAFGLAGK